jgi:hypothetical protein
MILGYRYRHVLDWGTLRRLLPVLVAAGLIWLTLAGLTIRSTLHVLGVMARSALDELGRVKLLAVIVLLLVG